MLKNYHTHTWRCHHASGTEREYIEAAIARGFKVLGFSDHVPVPDFPNGYQSGFRMDADQAGEYVATLLKLKHAYAEDIDILIGYEAEYYPELFAEQLDFLRSFSFDYLLLGQHNIKNEYDSDRSLHTPTADCGLLREYVDQVIEGLETGAFAYLAHPDLIPFVGDDEDYAAEMSRLCVAAREMNIPLECNLLGVRDHRNYPDRRFWRVAAAEGCTAILGCDAHGVSGILDTDGPKRARRFLRRCGMKNFTEDIRLSNDRQD